MVSLVAVIRVGSPINWNKLLQLRKRARSMPHLVEDLWYLGLKCALKSPVITTALKFERSIAASPEKHSYQK
jgi:hypothetical protein